MDANTINDGRATESNRQSSLRNLSFPESLDTSEDDVAKDLYIPAMCTAVSYDRGVGYFTSGWLTCIAEGLAAFAKNGGKMRLITSPHLSPEDWSAVKKGNYVAKCRKWGIRVPQIFLV